MSTSEAPPSERCQGRRSRLLGCRLRVNVVWMLTLPYTELYSKTGDVQSHLGQPPQNESSANFSTDWLFFFRRTIFPSLRV